MYAGLPIWVYSVKYTTIHCSLYVVLTGDVGAFICFYRPLQFYTGKLQTTIWWKRKKKKSIFEKKDEFH